jgi:hypothetical protein
LNYCVSDDSGLTYKIDELFKLFDPYSFAFTFSVICEKEQGKESVDNISDLVKIQEQFIEKGYNFVLDADISSGENKDGEYSVFVEISRSDKLAEHIEELTYGVKKLTGLDEFKFKYYKQTHVHEVNTDNLKSKIPSSVNEYKEFVNRNKTEDVKRFFSKTLMDDFKLDGNMITITKPFGSKIQLEMVKDGDAASILEGVTDGYTVDQAATSEVFWLTKVLGDYTINKIGDTFVFNNGNRSMLLKRI